MLVVEVVVVEVVVVEVVVVEVVVVEVVVVLLLLLLLVVVVVKVVPSSHLVGRRAGRRRRAARKRGACASTFATRARGAARVRRDKLGISGSSGDREIPLLLMSSFLFLHSAKVGAVETGCSDIYDVIH